jgi:hypothetical protein
VCAGKCWKAIGRSAPPTGYKYRNGAATPDGFVAATLKSGAAGKALVAVKARGPNVRNPMLGLTLPVTVQLVVGDDAGTACWQATFAAATTNTANKFKAKGP